MSDKLPGSSFSNPIKHRGWLIFLDDCAGTHPVGYAFVHEDYDPTPLYADDGPSDHRHGWALTLDEARAEIDEQEDEAGIAEIEAEQAKIDAGVQAYIDQMPIPSTLDAANLERDFWIREACRFSRNEDYYRGLLDQIAEHIGEPAHIADDGSRSESPLRAKLPELVGSLAAGASS